MWSTRYPPHKSRQPKSCSTSWTSHPTSSGTKGWKCSKTFNIEVEDFISAARQELRGWPSLWGAKDKSTLERATECLEEGVSALKRQQKLIKVVVCSEFGWGASRHYQYIYVYDPLADDSDDEKELRRADKATQHDFEDKKPRGGKRGWRYAPMVNTTRTTETTLGLGIYPCQLQSHQCLFLLKDRPDQGHASHVVCLAIWHGHVLLKEDSTLCTSLR